MKYMIVVFTMLNSSGEFPDPSYGSGGRFNSMLECEGYLLERKMDKHTLRKNSDGHWVLYSNDGQFIWAESCVPVIG